VAASTVPVTQPELVSAQVGTVSKQVVALGQDGGPRLPQSVLQPPKQKGCPVAWPGTLSMARFTLQVAPLL
jgi:hypothetical protein